MDLVSLLVAIIIFGLIVWLIQNVLPLPPPFKNAALAVLAIILILWLVDGLNGGHLRLLVR